MPCPHEDHDYACIAIANIVATDCTKIAILQPIGGPDRIDLLRR